MKYFMTLLSFCIVMLSLEVTSQNKEFDPGWQWARLSNTVHSSGSESIRTDFDNNIISLFFYNNTIQIEDTSFYHTGWEQDRAIAIVKRNSQGDFLKAADIFTKPGAYLFNAYLETDMQSNIYIYGDFSDSLFVNNHVILPVFMNQQPDLYLIKLNSNLEYQWSKVFAGIYQDDCRGIDISDDQSIYLSRMDYHYRTISEPEKEDQENNTDDLRITNNVLMKLDTNGNTIWRFDLIDDQGGSTYIWNTVAGKDGFIYILGGCDHDLIIQGDTIKNPDFLGFSAEDFIIQFDPEGVHHDAFFNPYRGFFIIDEWFDVDPEGNYFISARSYDTLMFEFDTINVATDSSFSFIAMMNRTFTLDWINGAMTSDGAYTTFQMELVEDGIAFAFHGKSRFYFMDREYAFNAVGQVFSGLYDQEGELAELQITDASIGTTLHSFTADNCGNLITDGWLRGAAHFGNDTLLTDGSSQHFLAKNASKETGKIDMPADTAGCGFITLQAPEGFTYYRWNGVLTSQNWFLADSSETIHLEAADDNGCWREAETEVTIWSPIEFSLGIDTTILLTDTLEIAATPGYESYLWSTGDTTPDLIIPASQLQIGINTIWLEISDGHCFASDTVNITIVDNSTVDVIVEKSIRLIPNPARSYVQIVSNPAMFPERVVFYNLQGIKVLDIRTKENKIDISLLETGIYIVELFFREEVFRKKLVIN